MQHGCRGGAGAHAGAVAADCRGSGPCRWTGQRFQRLRVNRRMAARRCAMVVRDTGGAAYVLRADFGARRRGCVSKSSGPPHRSRRRFAGCSGRSGAQSAVAAPEQKIILMEFVPGDTLFREMTAADLGMVSRARRFWNRPGAPLPPCTAVHRWGRANSGRRRIWSGCRRWRKRCVRACARCTGPSGFWALCASA